MFAIVFDVTGDNFIDTVMTVALFMVIIVDCRGAGRFGSSTVHLSFEPFNWNV